MAAGRGTRLAPRTDHEPKCLTPLAGRPLLSLQLAALADAGGRPVAVVTGHLADHIARAAPDAHRFHNPDFASTHMVATLEAASEWLTTGTCVISYSDVAFDGAFLGPLLSAPGDIVVANNQGWRALWEARFDDPCDDAETFVVEPNSGRLLGIGDRPSSLDDVQGQFAGLFKTTPAGWEACTALLESLDDADRAQLQTTRLLSMLIARGVAVHTATCEGRWVEVDDEHDLEVAERYWSSTS